MKRFIATLLFAALAVCAFAHDPKLSGVGISVRGGLTTIAVQFHLRQSDADAIRREVAKRLDLTLDGIKFAPREANVRFDVDQRVAYWTATYPQAVRSFSLGSRLFPEEPDTRSIVTYTVDGKEVSEKLLDAGQNSMSFGKNAGPSGAWAAVRQFLGLGVFHIFTGPDHILFILGLILTGGTLKSLLKTVTAFTVAHSLTLTLAATGVWVPASRIIEPLIALSIVAVAAENFRSAKGGPDWRPLIAFAFGLIHGFGFAGGLTEAGLPSGALGWALGAFNLGVELAQASIVLAVFPLLALLKRHSQEANRRFVFVSSCAISLAGAFWFFERLSGS